MIVQLPDFRLRPPELKDCGRLYEIKNNPEIAALLGGFSMGYSTADIAEWIETHRMRKDERIWVIADPEGDECIGHVGLYHIDHRIRSAEFAILIGLKDKWGKGLGRSITSLVINWGFRELNMNRIYLSVLKSNERAIRVYSSLGFVKEGIMRQAQFRDGQYIDLILMSLLESEYQNAV